MLHYSQTTTQIYGMEARRTQLEVGGFLKWLVWEGISENAGVWKLVSYNVRQYYKAKRATVFEAEGDGHLVQGEKEEEEETEIQPLELLRPMKNMIAVSSFFHLSKVYFLIRNNTERPHQVGPDHGPLQIKVYYSKKDENEVTATF
ncbi:unnamed protein product [Citrullus colocynthis]|uniref:Uncharacterized protein n=1 Tax=Citrullus colocynthis TaxID=252529 RepID=A0ABP0Y2T2_9ROSI